jgi:hypothetical protein
VACRTGQKISHPNNPNQYSTNIATKIKPMQIEHIRAVEITATLLHNGRKLQPGDQLVVINPASLPPGFVNSKDASALVAANAARAIFESELQAQEDEL